MALGRIDENGGYAVPERNTTASRPPTYNAGNVPAAQLGSYVQGIGVSAPLTLQYLQQIDESCQYHDAQAAQSWLSATTELDDTEEGCPSSSLRPCCFRPLELVPTVGSSLNEQQQHLRAAEAQETLRLPFMVQRLIHDQSCLHEEFRNDEFGFPTKHCHMMTFVPMSPTYCLPPTQTITGRSTVGTTGTRRCSSNGSHNTGSRRSRNSRGSRGSRGSNDKASSGDGICYQHFGAHFAEFERPMGDEYEDFVLYSSAEDEDDIFQFDG